MRWAGQDYLCLMGAGCSKSREQVCENWSETRAAFPSPPEWRQDGFSDPYKYGVIVWSGKVLTAIFLSSVFGFAALFGTHAPTHACHGTFTLV